MKRVLLEQQEDRFVSPKRPRFQRHAVSKHPSDGRKAKGAARHKGSAPRVANQEVSVIGSYLSELCLLKDVPFSYLVPDEKLLPPESIRFFYLDENWLNALTDGALSIGRIARLDAKIDGNYFPEITTEATEALHESRFDTTHKNHRKTKYAPQIQSSARTGFLLRSELVAKWKGLETFAYGFNDGDKSADSAAVPLSILRMDSLSSEVLLCIFDGILVKFVISEPYTGLRFGAPDNIGIITLRNMNDKNAKDFGSPLEGVEVDLNCFTATNGRLDVSALAARMNTKLGADVGSPQWAFQMIAVAKRAEFIRTGFENTPINE